MADDAPTADDPQPADAGAEHTVNPVERDTGPLPADVFDLHKHAQWCAGKLFVLRKCLEPAPSQTFDPPREEQIKQSLKALEVSARTGKARAQRLAGELVSTRVANPFTFPRCGKATAHQAVFELATKAIVIGNRGGLTLDLTLTLDEYETLQRELTWEAAAIRDRRSHETPCQSQDQIPFVPTPLQKAILNALNGRALKVEPLANEVAGGEKSRFYRKGGLKELKERKLVMHKHGVGYYRPDAPPE